MGVFKRSPRITLLFFLLLTWFDGLQPLLINVALRKSTRQIDTFPSYELENAVDGNRNQNGYYCSHTKSSENTWWMVDLGGFYDIQTIRITNRLLPGYVRLKDFSIYVSQTNPLQALTDFRVDEFPGMLCLQHFDQLPQTGPIPLECKYPVRGRFVYLWKRAYSYLSICEFEVLISVRKMETKCNAVRGNKLYLASLEYYSRVVRPPTLMKCLVTCMSTPKDLHPTHVQMDKASGVCYCIDTLTESSGSPPPDDLLILLDENVDFCAINSRVIHQTPTPSSPIPMA